MVKNNETTQIMPLVVGIKALFSSARAIRYKGLSVGEPRVSWQRALSEGLSYTAPFLLSVKFEGIDKQLYFCNIPLFTPRGTFVIEGKERTNLKILSPTDITEEYRNHLSPAEKTRDLQFYTIRESNFYDYLSTYLCRRVKGVINNGDISKFLAHPEYFVGGLDCFLRIFNSKFGTEKFPFLDSTNPLSEVEHSRKVSFIRGARTKEGRDIHPSHYGRLCVVESPESEKIGMRLHLAHKAEFDNKTEKIISPLKHIKTGKTIMASPDVDKETFIVDCNTTLKGKTLARGGEDAALKKTSDIQYSDAYADQLFGYAALQIPFIQHNDPARALMGAKNLKQAVPLKNPDIPIICTGYETNVAELSGRIVRCEKSGIIQKVSEGEIVIEAGNKKSTYNLIKGSPSVSSKSAVFQSPTVKEGDKAKKGQIIAEGAAIKNGSLALGANFLIAYMPYYGFNMDDGIVVSEKVAAKLTSVHIEEFDFPLKEGDIPQWLAPEDLKLQQGTPLVILKRKKEEITRCATDDMQDGIVLKVISEPDRIRLWIKKERPLEVGDKIMGRHGNKGIIAKILPVNRMPFFQIEKNGEKERKYVDIVLNPHSIISRMNIGQLYETHLGWIAKNHPIGNVRIKAEVSGKPFNNIDLDLLSKWLAESGLDNEGKIKLNINENVVTENPVVVGYQYIVKLNHLAANKLSARGSEGPTSFVTDMPLGGKKRGGGQRIGEMEIWALLAHGAWDIVKEMLGEKANSHILNNGGTSISESLKTLIYYLRGLGMRLNFLDSNNIVIEPEDFERTDASELKTYMVCWADNSEIAKLGRHMFIPKKRLQEGLKDFHERKKEESEIRMGARNIRNLNELEPGYKDEMGYIDLKIRVKLCGREINMLPVIPLRCRPYPGNKINKLYRRILLSNIQLLELQGSSSNKESSKIASQLKNSVKELEKELTNYISGKEGVIRKAILGKRVNFSGRAVIIPNPDIKAETAEIPERIMAKLNLREGDKVLLNRQPSLHVHNIQAFNVKKSIGNVIAINPLVCGGFNADFDGDTMAIYKVKNEIPENMRVSRQIILPANGRLNLSLSQDIVSGIYYATGAEDGRKELAGIINDDNIYTYSYGRVDKKALNTIVYKYFKKTDDRDSTLKLSEEITRFGLKWATLSGITFGIFDLRKALITETEKKILHYDNKLVEDAIENNLKNSSENPISIMVISGARGDKKQLTQMAGVKGVIDRMGGKKTSVGINSCYLEGLSPTEYYLACYGARKSLGDKKLLTPECGYLTRKLVFAASDVIISEDDCKTTNGIDMEADNTIGRTLTNKIVWQREVLLEKDAVIDEGIIEILKSKGIKNIMVRSPLTCESSEGICSKCYGWDLSKRTLPSKGFAAGIMAAEVIGERATQDAMRTYHVGTATGTVTLFAKVKAIFDNSIDPDTKKKWSEQINRTKDLSDLANTLFTYYEKKVDVKHYEILLKSLMIENEFKGTKGSVETNSVLHRVSFERALAVLNESAAINQTYPLKSMFEKLYL